MITRHQELRLSVRELYRHLEEIEDTIDFVALDGALDCHIRKLDRLLETARGHLWLVDRFSMEASIPEDGGGR